MKNTEANVGEIFSFSQNLDLNPICAGATCDNNLIVMSYNSLKFTIIFSAILQAPEILQQERDVDDHWNSLLFYGTRHPNSDVNIIRGHT